jgi:hypothetical protein
MKFSLLLAGLVAAGVAAAVATSGSMQAHAAPGSCLKIRDLGDLKPLDETTSLASSRHQGNFIVKFRSPCRDLKFIDNFYTLRVQSQSECFDGNDVLQFRYGGLCFVQSVTPSARN